LTGGYKKPVKEKRDVSDLLMVMVRSLLTMVTRQPYVLDISKKLLLQRNQEKANKREERKLWQKTMSKMK